MYTYLPNIEIYTIPAQLSAKQALWALSRAAVRVAFLAASQPQLMHELVAAMTLSNRWESFECVLFAVHHLPDLLYNASCNISNAMQEWILSKAT